MFLVRTRFDSGSQGATMVESKQIAVELVFAIAHEIGNHLGGIRLQAHLIDEELDARSLAEASIVIDEMASRSGLLLTLLRPLLSDDWRASGGETWASLLGRVQRHLEDEGTRGVRLEFGPVADDGLEAPDLEWLHSLLVALVGVTMTNVGARGTVHLALETRGNQRALVVEDDGEEEDLSPDAAHRGRPLAVAIARELIGRTGGQVNVQRTSDGASKRTRIELIFGGAR